MITIVVPTWVFVTWSMFMLASIVISLISISKTKKRTELIKERNKILNKATALMVNKAKRETKP